MKLVLGMLISLLCASSVAFSGPKVEKEKALVISGVIAQGNILPVGKALLDRANAGEEEVQLIINSPGGEVVTGFLFLNLMEAAKQKGLKITCFVPTMAESMAYHILLHCSERHVLNNAFLLWHRARIMMGGLFGQPMTSPQLEVLARGLAQADEGIFEEIVKYMSEVSSEVLAYHFEAETLHTGLDVHKMDPEFITSHTAVDGLFDILMDKSVPRNQELDKSAMRVNQVIYISEQVM